MSPYFSVIIPTYNRWQLLQEALGSVAKQDYQDLEILVIDDGSTDETSQQVRRLNLPIHLLSCNRGGPAQARNVGIQEARGEFVAFLDSDDLWAPSHLASAKACIDGHPDIEFLFADTELTRTAGVLDSYVQGKSIEDVPYHAEDSWRVFQRTIYPELVREDTVITSGAMVRRGLLTRLGGFDEQLTPFGEDTDLWLRVCATAQAAGNWSVTVRRRKLDDGLMNSGQEFLWRSKHIDLFRNHAVGVGALYKSLIAQRLADLYQERMVLSLSRRRYRAATADLFWSARFDLTGLPHRCWTLGKRAQRWMRRHPAKSSVQSTPAKPRQKDLA